MNLMHCSTYQSSSSTTATQKADGDDDEINDCLRCQSQIPTKRSKGGNFNNIDLNDLLLEIEARLPMSNPEWEGVAKDHTQKYPTKKRVAKILRLKFGKLWQMNVPTGDPNIPVHIREAKCIWRMIQAKIPMSNMQILQEIESGVASINGIICAN
jgi:hypothetical protein